MGNARLVRDRGGSVAVGDLDAKVAHEVVEAEGKSEEPRVLQLHVHRKLDLKQLLELELVTLQERLVPDGGRALSVQNMVQMPNHASGDPATILRNPHARSPHRPGGPRVLELVDGLLQLADVPANARVERHGRNQRQVERCGRKEEAFGDKVGLVVRTWGVANIAT